MENKVVLVLVDGMRPDGIRACGSDALLKIAEEGTSCLEGRTVMPSVTLPCHTSLFFSVEPSRHGILTNTWMPQVRPIDSLGDTVKKAGGFTAMFYNWEQLRDLNAPGSMDRIGFYSLVGVMHNKKNASEQELIDCTCKSEIKMTDDAIRCIKEESPDFMFLYLGLADEAGHHFGWMGESYLTAVRNASDCIQKLKESLPPEYSLIITADHGGHDRTHGTEAPEDMTIPIIFWGKPFTPGKKLESANIMDIAPTITKVMGIQPPEEWNGRSVL